MSKILFLTRENKIHIFKQPCNFLFIIWTINIRDGDCKVGFNTNTGHFTNCELNTKYKILGAQGIKMFKQSNTSEWD